MNASKENAQTALDNLLTQERFMNEYAFNVIKEFLEAAKLSLPSESAFASVEKKRKAKS